MTTKRADVQADVARKSLCAAVTALLILITFQSAFAVTAAFDDASKAAYTDGWQSGDNGGTGFGPWTLFYSGSTNGLFYQPQFIDNGPLAGDSLGKPSFALTTGDQNNQFETSEAVRTFSTPIAVGQTLSADIDGSAISNAPAFTTGNTFDLLGTNGSERFSLFTSNGYHANRWTSTGDADTGIAPGSSFHFEFTLVDTNTFNLTLTPIGGGTPYFSQTAVSLAGTAGVALNRLRITAYGTGSSADGSKELFFDNMLITSPGIPGDFNQDNHVDAADYVVWRHSGLDVNAYQLWRSHFGQSASGAATAGLSLRDVPEPSSISFALGAAIVCVNSLLWRRRRACPSAITAFHFGYVYLACSGRSL